MWDRKRALVAYYDADEKLDLACVSKSPDFVCQAIEEYRVSFENARQYLNEQQRHQFEIELEDMQLHLLALEEPKWLEKAESHLLAFAEAYELVTCGDLDDPRDATLLNEYKKKCLSEWQSFFAVDVSVYKSDIRPEEYLKEHMDDLYDPCMKSYETLRQRLYGCTGS